MQACAPNVKMANDNVGNNYIHTHTYRRKHRIPLETRRGSFIQLCFCIAYAFIYKYIRYRVYKINVYVYRVHFYAYKKDDNIQSTLTFCEHIYEQKHTNMNIKCICTKMNVCVCVAPNCSGHTPACVCISYPATRTHRPYWAQVADTQVFALLRGAILYISIYIYYIHIYNERTTASPHIHFHCATYACIICFCHNIEFALRYISVYCSSSSKYKQSTQSLLHREIFTQTLQQCTHALCAVARSRKPFYNSVAFVLNIILQWTNI